jgi:primosomal protein N' (replication factor Y)
MKCPHCDVSLSEHGNGQLICHYCGYTEPKPKICPQCGSKYISGFRAGTQQIEEKLKEMFPRVRVLRMDADTTKTKESYEKILSAFANGEADVLVGTQMIVKGHDFPRVTLVGILAADLSLAAGDYRAGERTFQLLTQAVGRAGRGNLPGEAVIQTYQPEHYAVTYAAAQDYQGFYQEEILYREMLGYPPVAHMLAVQIYSQSEERGTELAGHLAVRVRNFDQNILVIGPAPASIGKIKDIFRFVFYIKDTEYNRLVSVKDMLEELLKSEKYPETVLFDFDPMNTL